MASDRENRSYADHTASYMDRLRELLQVLKQGLGFRLGEALRRAEINAKIISDYRSSHAGTILNPSLVDKMSDEEVLKAALMEQAGKSKQVYISADNRTPLEKQRLLAAFKTKEKENTLRKLIETNSEAMDRTFGMIPIGGSILRAGRTQILRDLNGYNPYGLLDAGSTLLDLGTSAFGLGGWKPLVGGYVGGEIGKLAGEKYGHPILGLFAGALAGGFTPNIINNVYYSIHYPIKTRISPSILFKSISSNGLPFRIKLAKKNRYFADILYPLHTYDAIKDNRYIPLLKLKNHLNGKLSVYQYFVEKAFERAKNRYINKYNTLSTLYNIPQRLDEFDILNINLDNIRNLYKKGLLEFGDLGAYNPITSTVDIGYNNGLLTNHLLPYLRFKHIIGHEMDHHTQKLLGINEKVRSSIYPNMWRSPISMRGKSSDGSIYSGIPKKTLSFPGVTLTKKGYLLEREGIFNPLAIKNNNFTWESSPNELMSEVAGKIDSFNGTKPYLYKDLNTVQSNKVLKYISNIFNLSENEAKYILDKASKKGYLRTGGKLNAKD